MKFLKKIIACILIAAVLVSAPLSPVTEMNVYAGSKTVTVKEANESTAKKVHNIIYKGKAATLKVKAKGKKADKLVIKLSDKIKKVNKQGVIFGCTRSGTSGKYTYYEISNEYAKKYKYAVKFIDKLYDNFRGNYEAKPKNVLKAYKKDYKKYPDEKTRKYRIFYDICVKYAKQYPDVTYRRYPGHEWDVANITVTGGDKTTCEIVKVIKDMKMMINFIYTNLDAVIKSADVDKNGNVKMKLNSFSGFKKAAKRKELIENNTMWLYYFSNEENKYGASENSFNKPKKAFKLTFFNKQEILYKAKDFYQLSDAMKVWVIGESNYFGCNFIRPKYGMLYSTMESSAIGGSAGMKALYKNEASGVCNHYAALEALIFTELDLECYVRSNLVMRHAWTVLKVKNSKGKTMWIPFDYGVGPSKNLMGQSPSMKEYLKSEKNRYSIYLSGIPNAPKKKNFKDSDFN
ncbi:MAG: hypothetical protein K6E13_06490 [Lachnospiraceae bacterium]|nr:hypothetical protein [Lachnospiraceae bacterium]